ncbi:glycosyltransferase family 4 protein [Cellulomonas rhizosphaerae]|uniref:Glycosyltransferase n=1 Tax=Cellulomonas rhizosphaerae TaxID=2293719 RepID=A0A413RM72_9CELL|nr:glycosyltransferase family 4 protein [Cellulomonas rhizosphaerae]RHA41942.1 glycosyltransferase [Cellulomonas rhizosphaerae]
MKPLREHVRLYDQARTAHLERERDGNEPTTLLYASRRYDFDLSEATGVDARMVSSLASAKLLWSSPVRVLEITEPAYLHGVTRAFVAVAALRARHPLRRGRRPLVVSYAIGNRDPRDEFRPTSLREHASFRAKWLMSRAVARWTDRLAFGTSDAASLYTQIYGRTPPRQERELIVALPSACTCGDLLDKAPGSIGYVGAFVERKGLPLVLAAWAAVRQADERATLTLVGKGDLVADAQALAERDSTVRVVVDPPRSTIHEVLRSASVVALPSQPSPTWREQVGLPIVEALAHGCTIVTTDESGLADWLATHGHHVVPGTSTAAELATSLQAAIAEPLSPRGVLADLPESDGRAQAHAWMFRPTGT